MQRLFSPFWHQLCYRLQKCIHASSKVYESEHQTPVPVNNSLNQTAACKSLQTPSTAIVNYTGSVGDFRLFSCDHILMYMLIKRLENSFENY